MAQTPFNPSIGSSSSPDFISDQSAGATAQKYAVAPDAGKAIRTGDQIAQGINSLANIVPAVATAGDRLTKNAIDSSIYDMNSQNQPWSTEFGPDEGISVGGAKLPTIPKDLEQSTKNLQKLAAAKSSGALSKTSFDIKVSAFASDLRSQYDSPYLRDYIDQKVQSVTGVDPQNAVRKDLFAQIAKSQESAIEADKQKTALAIANAKEGLGVPNWQQMSLPQMIDATAASNRILRDSKIRMQQMDEELKTRTLTDDTVLRNGQHDVTAYGVQNINNILTQMGTTPAEFDANIKNFTSLSDEKRVEVAKQMDIFTTKTINDARTYILKNYDRFGKLDDKKIQEILSPLTMYMQNFKDGVVAGNPAAIKEIKDQIDYLKTNDQKTLLGVPGVRQATAANALVGSLGGGAMLESHLSSIVKNADRVMFSQEKNKTFGTEQGQTVTTTFENLGREGVDPKSKAYEASVKMPIDVIKDMSAKPEAVEKAVFALYSRDNSTFIAKLSDADKNKYYSMLYSADALSAMEKRRDAGDNVSYNTFVDSARGQFGPMFRQAGQNIAKATLDSSRYVVSYDQPNHQFVVQPRPVYTRGGAVTYPTVPKEVTLINQALKTITPILEKNGENVDDFLKMQFDILGVHQRDGTSWVQSNNPLIQLNGAFNDSTKSTEGVTTSAPMHLGAPGSGSPNSGSPTPPRTTSIEVRKGQLAELNDLAKAVQSTDDPTMKAELLKEWKSVLQEYRSGKAAPEAMNVVENTKGGPDQGLGQPDADLLNTLTGSQDFIDAVKSGDPKEVAKQVAIQAATLIPFPGSRALIKGAEEAVTWGPKFDKLMGSTYKAAESASDLSTQYDILAAKLSKESGITPEFRAAAESKLADLEKQMGPEGMQAAGITPTFSRNADVVSSTTLEARRAAKGMEEASAAKAAQGDVRTSEKMDQMIADNQAKKAAQEQLVTEHATQLTQRMTPEEIGKRITQLNEFKQFTKDPRVLRSYEEELKVLLKARELNKSSIRTVE